MKDFTEMNAKLDKEMKWSTRCMCASCIIALMGICMLFYALYQNNYLNMVLSQVMLVMAYVVIHEAEIHSMKADLILTKAKVDLLEEHIDFINKCSIEANAKW